MEVTLAAHSLGAATEVSGLNTTFIDCGSSSVNGSSTLENSFTKYNMLKVE